MSLVRACVSALINAVCTFVAQTDGNWRQRHSSSRTRSTRQFTLLRPIKSSCQPALSLAQSLRLVHHKRRRYRPGPRTSKTWVTQSSKYTLLSTVVHTAYSYVHFKLLLLWLTHRSVHALPTYINRVKHLILHGIWMYMYHVCNISMYWDTLRQLKHRWCVVFIDCILCWFLDFLLLTLSCLGVGGRFICYSCMHACATAITLIAIKLPDVARLSANPLRTRTRRRRPTPRCLALKPVWSCREEVYVWFTKGASHWHCSSFTSWVTVYFSAYPFVMSYFLILFYIFFLLLTILLFMMY